MWWMLRRVRLDVIGTISDVEKETVARLSESSELSDIHLLNKPILQSGDRIMNWNSYTPTKTDYDRFDVRVM